MPSSISWRHRGQTSTVRMPRTPEAQPFILESSLVSLQPFVNAAPDHEMLARFQPKVTMRKLPGTACESYDRTASAVAQHLYRTRSGTCDWHMAARPLVATTEVKWHAGAGAATSGHSRATAAWASFWGRGTAQLVSEPSPRTSGEYLDRICFAPVYRTGTVLPGPLHN